MFFLAKGCLYAGANLSCPRTSTVSFIRSPLQVGSLTTSRPACNSIGEAVRRLRLTYPHLLGEAPSGGSILASSWAFECSSSGKFCRKRKKRTETEYQKLIICHVLLCIAWESGERNSPGGLSMPLET